MIAERIATLHGKQHFGPAVSSPAKATNGPRLLRRQSRPSLRRGRHADLEAHIFAVFDFGYGRFQRCMREDLSSRKPARRRRAGWAALAAVLALLIANTVLADGSGVLETMRVACIAAFAASGVAALMFAALSLKRGDRSIVVWASLVLGALAAALLRRRIHDHGVNREKGASRPGHRSALAQSPVPLKPSVAIGRYRFGREAVAEADHLLAGKASAPDWTRTSDLRFRRLRWEFGGARRSSSGPRILLQTGTSARLEFGWNPSRLLPSCCPC